MNLVRVVVIIMIDSNYKYANYYFNIIGLGFKRNIFFTRPLPIFAGFFYTICIGLGLLQMLWTKIDVVEFAKLINGIFIWTQCLIMLGVRIIYENDFIELLEVKEKLWTHFKVDSQAEKRIKYWLNMSKVARYSTVTLLFAVMTATVGRSFVGNELPLDCWIPNTLLLNFRSLQAIQIFLALFTNFLILGCNLLLLGMLLDLILQFCLLNWRLRTLEVFDEDLLKDCIEHHSTLNRWISHAIISNYNKYFFLF